MMPFGISYCITQNELAYISLAANNWWSKKQRLYVIFGFQALGFFGEQNQTHHQVPKYSSHFECLVLMSLLAVFF